LRLLGWDFNIRRSKSAVSAVVPPFFDPTMGPPFWGGPNYGNSAGWPVVHEPFTGAWQRNMDRRYDTMLSYFAVYACVSLIASDISKLRLRLMEVDDGGVWEEVDSAAFSPVLRRPNNFQNRIKFLEQWVVSKLTRGNTYVLKERDQRGVVIGLYVLDPNRTKPLVTPNGDVYYQLAADNLAGIPHSDDGIIVPATEVIHDVMVPLYHPLCGVSPIVACAMGASQGINIQASSTTFFANGSNPGGVLTAPGPIKDETAKRIKEHWERQYTGANVGKVAVLGDGLKYEQMHVTAHDAQLIEQLKWTGEMVCSCFHVPPHMIGIAVAPAYNNIEALKESYYSQCLQALMESIELCVQEGLGLPDTQRNLEVAFDLEDLLRMDTLTKVQATKDAIGAGFLSPNEARARFDLPPVDGGESPYLQQQNYSLAALKRRDEEAPPVTPGQSPGGGTPPAAGSAPAAPPTSEDQADAQTQAQYVIDQISREADAFLRAA
jgi:HK97 family phage portal protein